MKRISILLAALALVACNQETAVEGRGPAIASPSRVVEVLETIDVDSYTYIRANGTGGEVWLATSPVSLSVGDRIAYSDSALMTDFFSPSLDRNFEEILFVGEVRVADSEQFAESNPHVQGTPMAGHPEITAETSVPMDLVDVPPLEQGMTISDVLGGSDGLEGTEVSLRAQVVKFTPNILDKNWVRLRDGTGEGNQSTLMATTSQTVEVGKVVTVTGTVKNDVSLGYGYDYEVLLEEAVFE